MWSKRVPEINGTLYKRVLTVEERFLVVYSLCIRNADKGRGGEMMIHNPGLTKQGNKSSWPCAFRRRSSAEGGPVRFKLRKHKRAIALPTFYSQGVGAQGLPRGLGEFKCVQPSECTQRI